MFDADDGVVALALEQAVVTVAGGFIDAGGELGAYSLEFGDSAGW
jgi:hypothetical protein